jgi:hypothetical protein
MAASSMEGRFYASIGMARLIIKLMRAPWPDNRRDWLILGNNLNKRRIPKIRKEIRRRKKGKVGM